MKIAFDIGGVLGKYPGTFIPLIATLQIGGADVYVLTDIIDQAAAMKILKSHGYDITSEKVICADYKKHGERCKAFCVEQYGIDLLIDDHPGYCVDSGCIALFVWPNPYIGYEGQISGT